MTADRPPNDGAASPAGLMTRDLQLRRRGGLLIATFLDNDILDAERVQEIARELLALIESERPRALVLNLRSVRSASAYFLGCLMGLHKRLAASGGELRACCLSNEMRLHFQLTQFERLIPVFDDERASLTGPFREA